MSMQLQCDVLRTQSPCKARSRLECSTDVLWRLPLSVMLCRHKRILFDTDECLRDDGLCVPTGNPYYPITRNGLDALVMRLVEESMVMSRSNTSVLGPTHPG